MCSVFKQNYEKHIVVVFLIDLRNICVVFLLFVYTVRKASSNCKKFLSLHPFDNSERSERREATLASEL